MDNDKSSKINSKSMGKLYLPVLVAIGVFVTLLCSALYLSRTYTQPEPFTEAEVVTFSTDTPDENIPDAAYPWKGLANDPRKIVIPSVGIDGYIQNVGVDQNSEIAVPNNVFIAGWFVDSVRPGDKGLSIIDGHVDGRNQSGAIFKSLPNVSAGDEASVVFGDGSIRRFKVVSKMEAPTGQVADVLYSQNSAIINQLNLITCVGTFNGELREYDKRIIVTLESI